MDEQQKPIILAPRKDTDSISRALLKRLNQWPKKPKRVDFENLPDDREGLALATNQGAVEVKRYIRGGYIGQYDFRIIYRVQPGSSTGKRLGADELLDSFADWISSRPYPELGQEKRVVRIARTAAATIYARYDDGSEDHQVFLRLTYNSI